jgi:hypothetical protein
MWIWSLAMSRIVRESASGGVAGADQLYSPAFRPEAAPDVRLSDYLQSEIITHPLPNPLLDRLADLYWTERESELAI